MRTRRSDQAMARLAGAIGALKIPLSGVVVLLAGLGFLVAPAAPAAAQPPAQGWTTTEAPLPTDAGNGSTDPDVYTASSTCPAANACVTVGWYSDTSGRAWGLIEQQNGTSWTDTEAPNPPGAGSGSDQGFYFGSSNCGFNQPCHAVSCPTATFCVAVGGYEDAAGYTEPVVSTLSNGSWSSADGALPNDAATDAGPTNFPDASYYSVSCASTTSCVAVGTYVNTSGVTNGLIATLSGTAWTAQPAPRPSDATNFLQLNGVSCPTASFCAVTGFYNDTSSPDAFNGWLLTSTNGIWTGGMAPEPSGAGDDTDSHQYAGTTQVTCPSATDCVVTGLYETTGGGIFPLIETWNGTGWTPLQGALPPGANTTNPEFDQLATVSCGSSTTCVAVGDYFDQNGKYFGLIDTLAGGNWTAIQAPQPSNADASDQYAELIELSCPTPAFCMTTGYYDATGATQTAFVDALSGGTWSVQSAPLPSNGQSKGRTAACYSPVACVVTGNYEDSADHTQGFLDTWTGAQGYWLDATDGGIFTYPNNTFYGSTGSIKLNKPMVGMDPTPDGQGYWLVASDGGIFTYGDAQFHGSRGGQPLNKPIVGMATTPDGQGYWLVASDGGIFTYGDANYYGSRGGQPINAPIVGMAATPDGGGYWLVGADGGIYSYGDALFHGSTGALKLNKPVVGMASTPTGLGYWLVASDGGVFNYGDANFYGSTGSIKLNKPVVGMASSPSGLGYWLVASDGGVFNYGDAPFQGSAGSLHLNAPVVGMAGG
jgi:hypothetical protein